MTQPYRIYGSEMSPYSVKVRSYMRYKGIPHEWIPRTLDKMEEFQRYAKLPLIPCVVAPDETAMQDSTPIIEALDARYPDPSIVPDDPAAAFLSALLEEYADEWMNKYMFHYRWTREVDQQASAEAIASQMMPGGDDQSRAGIKTMLLDRMPNRLWFVGSSAATAPQLEARYKRLLALLEEHLRNREYLFGGRPALADFGVWAQLYELYTDPTPHSILKSGFPAVIEYIERGLYPEAIGEFEPLAQLLPTLEPILREEIGELFLPWSDANARALQSNPDEEFSVELQGKTFAQKPQKYHARSLKVLRERYGRMASDRTLDDLLERTSCLKWLRV